jgi:hypothetical protein
VSRERKAGTGFCDKRQRRLRGEPRSGNGRLLRPQPAAYPAGRVALYPLSYRRMGRRTGFEPATSRFADEVSAIFTTDRGEGRRGTIDAVAALIGRRVSNEVTDIFTTASPMREHRRLKEHAGEQAISVSVTSTRAAALRQKPEPWRVAALARRPPRCVTSKAGIEPAFPWSEVSDIFTTSVG